MDKNLVTERILNLTLEIIYVLTGEDYEVVKKKSDRATACKTSRDSRRSHGSHDPVQGSPPEPLVNEGNKDQQILEPTNKLLHLLTREVPGRCEDITVRFTMEEQDDQEEEEQDYKEAVMENPQSLCSLDGSGNRNILDVCSESRPTPGCAEQDREMDEGRKMFNVTYKEEEIPTEISPAGCETETDEASNLNLNNAEDFQRRILDPACTGGITARRVLEGCYHPDFTQDFAEDNTNPQDCQVDKEDGLFKVLCKEEEIPTEISPAGSDSVRWETSTEGQSDLFCASTCASTNRNVIPNDAGAILTLQNPPNQCMRSSAAFLDIHAASTKGFHVTGPSKGLLEHLNAASHPTFQRERLGRSLFFKSKSTPFQKRGKRAHVCPDCGKSYRDNANLVKHQRVHTGEKPFSCSDCGKSFTHKSTLVKHQRLHTGTFSCSDCGKCFSDKTGLVIHRRIHTGEKPFVCSECGRRFTQMPHLVAHQSTHKSDMPFSCSDCGKCFSIRSVLVAHQMVHTREKAFACSECGKCFAHRSGLATHQRIHTG
uniref:C2H2-type domain-containing protein n=1 Tax=Leptobrachium leishanense TaxID=445787 RepID=A0A8C5PAH2_9ANUR